MNKRYTKEDDKIIEKYAGKKSWKEIGVLLNKTSNGVRSRAKKLKINGNYKRPNKKTMDKVLKKGFIPIDLIETTTKKALFKCPHCKNNFEAMPSNLARKSITSCGCVNIGRRTGTNNIPGVYFARIKTRCNYYKIDLDLDIDYIDNLLVKQKFKCKLSGLDISLSYSKNTEDTASLDRIDSSKGYIKGNVQWVHKDVNMMKKEYSMKYFIEICKRIANNA